MKQRTIIIIAVIMGISFAALLVMQITYITQMSRMKREQFDESVNRALYQAARNIELNETLRFLEEDMSGADEGEEQGEKKDVVPGAVNQTFESRSHIVQPAMMPKGIILNSDRSAVSEASRSMKEMLRNRYVYQKAVLDEVIYRILYTASEQPLNERINFKQLDQDLKAEFLNNGLNMPYHFTVTTRDGREVYHCPDYATSKRDIVYTQLLFRNDVPTKMGVINVNFPDMGSYIFDSIKFMIPSLIFTLILLITFIFTLVVVFRQKKLSEIKNDFINNMTHELKTPISSIDLAAQMLSDKNIAKSESLIAHLASVFSSETKRLRFLVEKVLQMSLFDRKNAIYNMKNIDINEMVESTAKTFQLRVEHTSGHIITDIEAVDSTVYGDGMHLQNVLFNLLDNAVKYCREDAPLELFIKTWNPDEEHVSIMVQDNGIGIKKENLRKIFDKFYRVHTGNVHDVKGFGLGLAYVKQIVDVHGGDIRAESEYKKGTTFTITLKAVADALD